MSKKRKPKKKKSLPHRYVLYEEAVQSPDSDITFFRDTFRQEYGRIPLDLREDFCGTFFLASEWVRDDRKHRACALDIDEAPLQYGKDVHWVSLDADQQSRLEVSQQTALSTTSPPVDIVAALNYSYGVLKKRHELIDYFRHAYRSLKDEGMLLVDVMGGYETYRKGYQRRSVDAGGFKDITYTWDQLNYDAVNNHGEYYIHFKFPDGRRMSRAFHYDWRIWSLIELRECMEEAGFRKTEVYWEGDDDDQGGNGIFTPSEKEENCAVWSNYVAGFK